MRMTLAVVFVSLAACGVDSNPVDDNEDTSVATNDVKIDPTKDGTEPAYVNGVLCNMVFPGALTPQTQTFAIWPIGTNGIVNTTYNTPTRPNVYAVFGTGTPLFETHHVAGQDAFDHYHVLEVPGNAHHVENATWDVLAFFPGPAFNPTTYVSAKSVSALFAQSAAGVLSPLMTLTDAGFPELVLRSPVQCPG